MKPERRCNSAVESQAVARLGVMVQEGPLRASYILIPAHLPADHGKTGLDTELLPKNQAGEPNRRISAPNMAPIKRFALS